MRKISFILVAMFVILFSVSCVCASDNTNMTVTGGTDISNINDQSPGNFEDLNHDINNIHSGETFNFTRNYKFDDYNNYFTIDATGIKPIDKVIEIRQNNIVINGNGFTIDAGGDSQIFYVCGNNVTVKNLIFTNSHPHSYGIDFIVDARENMVNSPITWQGNNGHMYNCTFCGNSAQFGGAAKWMGSNGTIDKCLFINNTATAVAGALYVGGVNNTISNCTFINCTSTLSGEAIFLDRNRKMIAIAGDIFTNKRPIIDGHVLGIDVSYLLYSHMVYAGGDDSRNGYQVDLVPALYSSIVNGVSWYNPKLEYFAEYNNNTNTFALNFQEGNIIKDSRGKDMDMRYVKSFCFKNITNFNQVFDALIHGNYSVFLTQNTIVQINGSADYKAIHNRKAEGFWFNGDKGTKNLTQQLTLKFTRPMFIQSDLTWDLKNMKYNNLVIFGEGSTIDGFAGDRNEKKWVSMNTDCRIYVQDLTVKKFNTALHCSEGLAYFNNVTFKNNRMDYIIQRDWGAAILNTGMVICTNCTFEYNYAKNGGAIFNQGLLVLDNNTKFIGNKAYGTGNDVCVGKGGQVQLDGKNITSNTNNIVFAKSVSDKAAFWAKVVAVAGSAVVGFGLGCCIPNPVVAVIVGAITGAGIGAITSAAIAAHTYDVKYDRTKNSLILIGLCTVAGGTGAFLGYYASTAGTAGADVAPDFFEGAETQGTPHAHELDGYIYYTYS